MVKYLNKIIPLRSNEKKAFWYCFAINFCFGLCFILGSSIAESLFLKKVGTFYLPQMIALNAIITMILYPVYDYSITKNSSDKIFFIMSFIFICVLIPSALLLISGDPPPFIYPVLFSIAVVSEIFFFLHFYSYLINFFDTLQTKRLLTYIFTAIILGRFIGGLSLSFFMRIPKGVSLILFIWAFLLGMVSVLVFLNRKNKTLKKASMAEAEYGFFEICRTNIQLLKNSKFISFSLIAFFFGDLAVSGAEILSQTILAESSIFPDVQSLTNFYGIFGAWSSLIVLYIQFRILPWLIKKQGVVTLNVILPLFLLFGLGGLSLVSVIPALILPFAMINRFNVFSAAEYIEPVGTNLLLSALNPQQKKKMLSFYGGFAEPFGPIIIGLLLTFLISVFTTQQIALILLLFAISYLGFSLLQNNLYTKELVRLLQSQNFDLFKTASEGMSNINSQVLAALTKNLHSKDENEAIISAQIMFEMLGNSVLPQFLKIFPNVGHTVQSEILQLIAKCEDYGSHKDLLLKKVVDFVNDKNPSVRTNAVSALNTLDKQGLYMRQIIPLLKDPEPKTACLAAVYLLNRNNAEQFHNTSMNLINSMLENAKTATLAARTLLLITNDSEIIVNWFFQLLQSNQNVSKEIAKILDIIFNKDTTLKKWKPFVKSNMEVIKNYGLTSQIREVRALTFHVLSKYKLLIQEQIHHLQSQQLFLIVNLYDFHSLHT